MIRLNLIGDPELTLKAAPLLGILGVESGEGITVNAVKGDRAGVCYKNGVATSIIFCIESGLCVG